MPTKKELERTICELSADLNDVENALIESREKCTALKDEVRGLLILLEEQKTTNDKLTGEIAKIKEIAIRYNNVTDYLNNAVIKAVV